MVAKCFYDTGLFAPKPFDVVVFKPPKEPQVNFEPRNYIKRLMGLPGDTVGIWYGDLYRLPAGKGPAYDDRHASPEQLWKRDHMHINESADLLTQVNSPFEIMRKPPEEIIAMRRIVFDNDHQPKDRQAPELARWVGNPSTWKSAPENGFISAPAGDTVAWVRYRNILRAGPKPELITDFMGYNTRMSPEHMGNADREHSPSGRNWVGDLMLECEVIVGQPEGLLILELSKGVDRFQARWQLSTGECRLVRLSGGQEIELDKKPTAMSKKGRYRLGFANVDQRLTVWVDGKLPFDHGASYTPANQRGPDENDLQPASIGIQGASVTVKKLRVWRDTYYTISPGDSSDLTVRLHKEPGSTEDILHRSSKGLHELFSDSKKWRLLRDLPCTTMYVQPDHYLCLGDNSPSSQDGREFGGVPARLLQGRAMLVYWPFKLGFWPFDPPENRFGPIR